MPTSRAIEALLLLETTRLVANQFSTAKPREAESRASNREELDRYEAKIEEFDIEGTLAFAEHLVAHSSRLWIEAGLEQRQRLQALFSPEGLSF